MADSAESARGGLEPKKLLTGPLGTGRVTQVAPKTGRKTLDGVRPILENSTACTMSNAKNLGIELRFNVEIPLENI